MNTSLIEIGSQLYINAFDTPEKIKAWVKQMKECNLTLIRLFIFWDRVEQNKGRWDFSQFDACFEEAELQEIKIIATITANTPPLWVKREPGVEDRYDLYDPKVWGLALNYVHELVNRYHKSKALHSWILWNEPGYNVRKSIWGIKAYTHYLEQTYNHSLEELNHVYRDSYQSFEEVATDGINTNINYPFLPYPQRLDWLRFGVYTLMEKLRDIQDTIKKLDIDHPTHVNPHSVAQCLMGSGQSIWEEAELTDFIGCSAHPSWHSTRFPNDRLHQSIALFTDLMKSATRHPDGLFWVSELQGGTNIFSGVTYLGPTGNTIRHWMWEAIGAGTRGIVFWCFNVRDYAFEAGEWGLLNQMGKPSERLGAIKEISEILNKNRMLFEKAVPPKPDVWILHSENTLAMSLIEGSGDGSPSNPRNQQYASDALCGAYLICSDLGLNIQFINEERFVSEGLENGSVLILPGTVSLKNKTCIALEQHVNEKGCSIIADGLCGYKDEYGFVNMVRNEWSQRIFGASVKDIQAIDGMNDENVQIKCGEMNEPLKSWFIRCIFEERSGVNVLGRYWDGAPAILENRNGTGKSIRIGTVFFQKYFVNPDLKYLELLRSLLPEKQNAGVILLNQSHSLRMKTLQANDSKLIILINTEREQTARFQFSRPAQLKGLNYEMRTHALEGDTMEVDVKAQGVLVFQITFNQKL